MADRTKQKGTSLVKAPAGLIGLALVALGVTGLIFGGQGFTTDPVDGIVNGEKWLGLELNGWSNLLFIGAGAVLLLGAPLHWGAKGMSLLVGLTLGAASVIAISDGDDVFGIFAANGPTELVWGVAAAVLLLLALLPRVGGRKEQETDTRLVDEPRSGRPVRQRRTEREPVADDADVGSRSTRDPR